ncbi:MAG: AI-2E family transporter, partial [Minisyncoccales bacterium]
MKENILDLSWSSIVKIFSFLVLFYFFFLIKDILILLLFALLLSFLMEKPILFFEKKGFSRFFSASFVYFLFAFFFFSFIYFFLPLFFDELKNFFFLIPDYLKKIENYFVFLNIRSFDVFSFLFEEFFKKDWTKILGLLRSFFSG